MDILFRGDENRRFVVGSFLFAKEDLFGEFPGEQCNTLESSRGFLIRPSSVIVGDTFTFAGGRLTSTFDVTTLGLFGSLLMKGRNVDNVVCLSIV